MRQYIEFFGKIRRYSNQDAIKLFGTDATQFLPLNIMIKQQKSCNIPEAYKVSLKFKDLTPNAFNIMAAYFTNSEQSSSGTPTNIFPTINVHRERSDAIGKALGKVEEKAQSVLEDWLKRSDEAVKNLVPQDILDLNQVLEILKQDFGCERLTIQSGGTLNSLFLRNNLFDYIDIVVAPLLVGGKRTPTIIDGESLTKKGQLKDLSALKLIDCQILKNSYLRLRYEVIK